jgi:type I restriction enzyme S subunit
MKKYQSYKSSSVKWIGEIPKSWEETRLKYVGNLYGGLTGKSGEDFKQDDNPNNKPYIPYTNIFRNTYISKNHVDYVVLEDGENQNKVKKFDLFFLMSSETYQDLGKPCILIDDIEELYLNSFCKGFRVNRIDVNPLFLNYQLLGSIHKELISIEGRGFTRINLRQDRLNETPIFLPPLQEQIQIVQFLDEKIELVDKLISKKERKITLLKEQRTSLINEVVIKGLNSNVEMKSSGVKWIGEIPEKWKKLSLRYVGNLYGGLTGKSGEDFKNDENPKNKPFIPYTNIYNNTYISKNHFHFVSIDDDENQNKVQKFDLFFLMSSETFQDLGKSCILIDDVEELYLNSFCKGFRVNRKDVSPLFLNYQLSSQIVKELISIEGNGFTRINLRQDRLLETPCFIPSINEQLQIVEFLDSKTKEIDDLVQLEKTKIDLLKEYRQSLISEVVTGKIKVTN